MADIVHSWGEANRELPAVITNGVNGPIRVSRRGELVAQGLLGSKRHALADEGSYFVVRNGTVGTGIAGIAASDGFNDLETFLMIRNTSTTKRLYMDYIKLQATAAGTNGVTFSYAIKLDTGASRYTSGAVAGVAAVNPNMDSSETAEATVLAGPLITTAATADARVVAEGNLRIGVIKVIGDTYLWDFGGGQQGAVLSQAGTAIANFNIPVPPVVLGETDALFLHEWGTSQTVGASYLVEAGFWMR
jgi:hypothetical protein